MLFMVPVTFVPSFFVWTHPTLDEYGIPALIGIHLSTGHFAWMKALSLADIRALEPTNFTRLIWGALLGFIFLPKFLPFGFGSADRRIDDCLFHHLYRPT